MPKVVTLRSVSESEKRELERLSRSRTAARRQVERAQIILGWLAGQAPAVTAEQVGCHITTVYYQLHQFNARGLAFLEDAPRSGRPLHYDEQQRGQLVVTAKTKPETLGLAFGHWTLDRLVEYANTVLSIPISRSQLADVLTQEGLKWYQEKTYFSDSPDPQFVEKRGRL
ncbi:MAG: helix-turn-helix domain containing protein [Anaerolineae bacterium]|nr:helix-turn-helix domain containing protein [Anaerolineae bacterium]